MPMGKAAAAQSQPPALPPLMPPPKGAMPLPPPPVMPPPPGPAPLPPLASPMPPDASASPVNPAILWKVKQQPDGSSVDYISSPDGDPSKDVVIAIHPPPKVPKAFQSPQAAQPGQS